MKLKFQYIILILMGMFLLTSCEAEEYLCEALGHEYVEKVVTPTCEEEGYTLHICAYCEDSYKTDIIKALEHSTEDVDEVLPTCDKEGHSAGTKCSRCNDKNDYIIYPALGHDMITDSKIEPTCTETGLTEGEHCSRCDYKVNQTIIEAIGHNYSSIVINPTCLDKGYTTHTCERCNDSYIDSYVESLGHDVVKDQKVEPTCTTTGLTEGCHCSRCDYVEDQDIIPALGHDYKEVVTNPTCTEQGFTTHTCERCNDSYVDSYIEPLGHSYSEWEIILEATEEATGLKRKVCKACVYVVEEVIPMLEHVHKYDLIVVSPTCTEVGYTLYTCKCGESYKDSYTDALGHDIIITKGILPSCTNTGLTDKEECTKCDYVKNHESIDALGHDLIIDEALDATCTADGLTEGSHCSRCKYKVTQEVIPALGHEYSDWVIVTNPSCNSEGKDEKSCIKCGNIIERDTRITGIENKVLVSNPVDKGYFAGKTLLTIGDSITCGVGLNDKTNEYYGKLVADALGMNVVNKGISGSVYCYGGSATTNYTLNASNIKNADVITIFLGINDFNHACKNGHAYGNPNYTSSDRTYYQVGEYGTTDTSTLYGALKVWCENIKQLKSIEGYEDKQFVIITPLISSWNASIGPKSWDQGKTNIHGHTLREYCTAIMRVYAEYEIPVFDANMLSGIYYNSSSDNNAVATGGDGVHINAEGHKILANSLTEFLLEGYSYEYRENNSNAHQYNKTIVDPTCTLDGYTKHICSICYDVYNTDFVDALGHEIIIDEKVEPTCVAQGYTNYTCIICGHTYKDNYVDLIDHNFIEDKCINCEIERYRLYLDDLIKYQGGINSTDGAIFNTFTNNWYSIIEIPKGTKQVKYQEYKTNGTYGIAFYEDDKYISGSCNKEKGGYWNILDIPEKANYLYYGYLYDEIAQDNNIDIFEYVEFIGNNLDFSFVEEYLELPKTQVHTFNVSVDLTSVESCNYTYGTDYGYIMLPTNYSKDGEPTRLVIVCHGAGASISDYKTSATKSNNYTYLTDLGFAIMDMYASPNAITHDNSALHYGNPVTLECYKAGYEYVMKHFNLAKDGIFILGSSMGGLSSFQIVQSEYFPVLAQVGYCPAVDLFKQAYCNPWTTSTYQRSRIAQYFNFDGTVSFTSNKHPSALEIEYYKTNFNKTINYSPILNNVISGDVNSILNYIPNKAVGFYDEEEELYNNLIANHPVPLLIFHNLDDSVVSYRYSKYIVDMINRGSGGASLYTFETGAHNAWANGNNYTIVDIDGNDLTIKESQYQTYLYLLHHLPNVDTLGHDLIVDEKIDPTCTETGLTEGAHCSRCDYLVKQEIVSALGHDVVIDEEVEATYYETGLSEGSHCDRCGEVLVEQLVTHPVIEKLNIKYDDYVLLKSLDFEIIDKGIPTSYKVGYGITDTLDDSVIQVRDGYLIGTGIGEAVIRIDNVYFEVNVETAPISIILLIGQSNMQGSEGNANQSIVCPTGQVYSTYGDRYTMTVDNARNFAPSALAGESSLINVEGNTSSIIDFPIYLLNEKGAGKAGPDSGFAYEWVKQTNEKVWVVNAAHGGSSINTWQKNGANYKEAVSLFKGCLETLQKEIEAGHFSLSHLGYFWCQGCSDSSQTAQWYINKYVTMHNNLKVDLAFDHDNSENTDDVVFEFGGIIPILYGVNSYRLGVSKYKNNYTYYQSYEQLYFNGPRVAQYWLGNSQEYSDIWVVCDVQEDWVYYPDGTHGVVEYFNAHYPGGIVDYETQVKQKSSWYKPTIPADVHDSIHYNQIGYNEIGRESVRNALIMLGEIEAPDVETKVEFYSWDGITTVDEIVSLTNVCSETLIVPRIYPLWKAKDVEFILSEGLEYNYYDLTTELFDINGTLCVNIDPDTKVNVKVKELVNYEFEFVDGAYASSNEEYNSISKIAGTFEDNVFIDARFKLAKPITLMYNQEWMLEFKLSGNWYDETSTSSKKLLCQDGA